MFSLIAFYFVKWDVSQHRTNRVCISLTPLRIAAYPGQVLDVVLENPSPPGSALTMDAMQLPTFAPEAKSILTPSPKAPQDYNNYDTGDIEVGVQALSIAPSAMGQRSPQTVPEGSTMYNTTYNSPPSLGEVTGKNSGAQNTTTDDNSHVKPRRNP